jgi:nickel-dependent lactate racemase
MLKSIINVVDQKIENYRNDRRYEKWDTEMEDKASTIMSLIMSNTKDSDKSEIFSRVRQRFDAYIDAKTDSVAAHLEDLKREQLRLKSPLPIEVASESVVMDRSESKDSPIHVSIGTHMVALAGGN